MDYTMHPGMGGLHEFHVYLRTNAPLEPETVLVAKSNWGP
jgi:hypothetical protein